MSSLRMKPSPSTQPGVTGSTGGTGGAGGAVTVALKFADDVLPCESLAAQVTTVVPTGIMLEDAGVHVTGRTPSTASEAVTGPKVNSAPPGPVATRLIGPTGMPLSTGAVVSVTVTLKLSADVLPCESLAVQVTMVVPTGIMLEVAGVNITGRSPSTRSDAVTGPKVSSAPPGPVATRLIGPTGTPLSTGAVLSVTVTLKLADDVLPCESLAVQVTTVVPTAIMLADAGVHITGRSPSTRSDAVTGPKVSSAPPGPVATRLIGPAGTPLSTGAVVSVTVTLKLADDVLPCESLAVQVTTVVPTAIMLADAGVHITGRSPSTRSDAVTGPKVSSAPAGPVASRLIGPTGTPLNTGAVAS